MGRSVVERARGRPRCGSSRGVRGSGRSDVRGAPRAAARQNRRRGSRRRRRRASRHPATPTRTAPGVGRGRERDPGRSVRPRGGTWTSRSRRSGWIRRRWAPPLPPDRGRLPNRRRAPAPASAPDPTPARPGISGETRVSTDEARARSNSSPGVPTSRSRSSPCFSSPCLCYSRRSPPRLRDRVLAGAGGDERGGRDGGDAKGVASPRVGVPPLLRLVVRRRAGEMGAVGVRATRHVPRGFLRRHERAARRRSPTFHATDASHRAERTGRPGVPRLLAFSRRTRRVGVDRAGVPVRASTGDRDGVRGARSRTRAAPSRVTRGWRGNPRRPPRGGGAAGLGSATEGGTGGLRGRRGWGPFGFFGDGPGVDADALVAAVGGAGPASDARGWR